MAPTRQMANIAFRQARQHNPTIDSNRFLAATAMYRPDLNGKRILVDEVGGVLNSLLGGAQVMAVTGSDHADHYTAAERAYLADSILVAALEKATTSTERVERPRQEGGATMSNKATTPHEVTIGHPTQFITFDKGVLAAVKGASATTYPVTPDEAEKLATALLAWVRDVELAR